MGMLFRYHEDNSNNKPEGAPEKVAPKGPEKKAEKSPSLTASEIRGMSGTKLRKIAKEYGIENPEELTVGELKSVLVEKIR